MYVLWKKIARYSQYGHHGRGCEETKEDVGGSEEKVNEHDTGQE